jgi:hypothetical protein
LKSDISGRVLRGSEADGQRANCLMEPVVVGKFMQAIASHHNDRRRAEVCEIRCLVEGSMYAMIIRLHVVIK